jgi:phage terminase large subunit-like protein
MVLKALVAGQGSGFRMTKAEIDQVQNARSKWQSMEAAFRKWSADPKEALFFDDAQRTDFSKLLVTMKKVVTRHLEEVSRARHDIDTLDEPRDIQKRLSTLHDERSLPAKEDKGAKTADAPKRSPADVWKQYSIGATK